MTPLENSGHSGVGVFLLEILIKRHIQPSRKVTQCFLYTLPDVTLWHAATQYLVFRPLRQTICDEESQLNHVRRYRQKKPGYLPNLSYKQKSHSTMSAVHPSEVLTADTVECSFLRPCLDQICVIGTSTVVHSFLLFSD